MRESVLTDLLHPVSAPPIRGYPCPSGTVTRRSWGICVGRTSFESDVLAAVSAPLRELEATTTLTLTGRTTRYE
jgi:hypothetical protein